MIDASSRLNQPAAPEHSESLIADIIDEFTEAMHRGECPDIEGFVRRCPANASTIREILVTLQAMCESKHPTSASSISTGLDTFVGKPIGDFSIIREIGRGGMGVVYEAEQLTLKRRVALKVLPFAAVLDPKQLQRFKNEALAAGQLRHPNIVSVLSVGSDRGVHYYAMELIDGCSLAEMIDELRQAAGHNSDHEQPRIAVDRSPLSTVVAFSTDGSTKTPGFFQTVARLGVQGARALDFAHEHGVVHRDIKPANLLMDAHGSLWVTDFGLAQVHDNCRITMTGDVLGTLRYMSPEQALAKRAVVDHRTDVYSLGVTLYELMTLEPAFSGHDRQEVLRRIAFDDPAPPHRINPATPVELETIVLKAMAKNPDERYGTAKELADDLERYLRDEPIRARRPTLAQRTIKWSRRHKPVVWSAAVSAAMLLVAAVVSLAISNVLITREKNRTVEALQQKESAIQEREHALTAVQAHKETAEANFRLARNAVDGLYTELAKEMYNVPRTQALQRRFLLEALDFYKQFAEQKGTDTATRFATALAYSRVGIIRNLFGQRTEANEAFLQATSLLESLVEDHPNNAEYRAELASAYLALGSMQPYRDAVGFLETLVGHGPATPSHQHRLSRAYGSLATLPGLSIEEAERALDNAVRLAGKLVAEFPERHDYHQNLAAIHYYLGSVLITRERFPEAEQALRQSLALTLPAELADSLAHRSHLASAHRELGIVLAAMGRIDDAAKECGQAIGLYESLVADFPDGPSFQVGLATCYVNMGEDQRRAGRLAESEGAWVTAAKMYENLMLQFPNEPNHAGTLVHILYNLAIHIYDRRPLEKRNTWTRIVELIETSARSVLIDSTDEFVQQRAFYIYAKGLFAVNRPNDAEPACRKAVELCEKLERKMPDVPGPKWTRSILHHILGRLAESAARPREAEASYRKAIELGPNSALYHNDLAWLLVAYPDDAIRDAEQAISLAKRAIDIQPKAANVWNTLGVAQYRAGEYREAIESLKHAESLAPGADFGANAFFIAMAQWRLGEHTTARQWFDRAVEWMDKNQPNNAELRRFRTEAAELFGIR